MVNTLRNLIVKITIGANIAGALVLIGLVVLTNADVFSRNILNAPFRGVVEMAIFCMILIVFLQLPDVVRTNRLTRSDGMLMALATHRPRAGRALSRGIDALACLFMCLIVWTVTPEFLESFESCHFFSDPEYGAPRTGDFMVDLKIAAGRCDYFGTPGILTAPWWPARLAIVFGVTFAAILFGLKALFGDVAPEENNS